MTNLADKPRQGRRFHREAARPPGGAEVFLGSFGQTFGLRAVRLAWSDYECGFHAAQCPFLGGAVGKHQTPRERANHQAPTSRGAPAGKHPRTNTQAPEKLQGPEEPITKCGWNAH